MPEPTVVWDARAILGEGPIWDERKHVLHWLDVEASTLHTLEPESGRRTSRTLPGRCSSVALREDGRLLVAHDRSVSLLEGDELVPFAPDISPEALTNDGAVDPRGRYLIGTVRPEDDPWTAALYRVDPDGSVEQLEGGLDISNGIDWSPDGRTMYFIDSTAHSFDAYDYDLDAGTLSNRRVIATIDPELGDPDGLTLDADGMIWLAVWGGSCLRRYSPDGQLLEELSVPAVQTTSCIFGGDDFRTLYVTSARRDLVDPGPHDGDLFAFEGLGVRGRPAFRFAG